MTLLELLKRIHYKQKIDLFNNNCTVLLLDKTREEIINLLLTEKQEKFREILNCEIQMIEANNNLSIELQKSF